MDASRSGRAAMTASWSARQPARARWTATTRRCSSRTSLPASPIALLLALCRHPALIEQQDLGTVTAAARFRPRADRDLRAACEHNALGAVLAVHFAHATVEGRSRFDGRRQALENDERAVEHMRAED